MIQAHMELPQKNNKPIKFVIVDHSLEEDGGHHLNYCQRVLGAAKSLGCKTVLLANNRLKANSIEGVDILVKKFDQNYWQYRNSLIKNYIKFLFFLLKIPTSNESELKFLDEFKTSLRYIDLEDGDLIFMPMLGPPELIGVSIFSKLNPELGLHWNFVFRRSFNLGFGVRSVLERRIVCAALCKFSKYFKGASANFYTDTNKLSREYNGLDFYKFSALPVPVSEKVQLKEKWDGVRALRIVYLGDARDEKGYQHLPQLVAGIRGAGFTRETIQFILQSNLSTGGNHKSLAAKNKLKQLKDNGLTLVDGPLTSNQYHDLLQKADIVVLPYSSREYASRSSGIFAEAVAAGIPTIFPKKSWMAQEAGVMCGIAFDNSSALLSCTLALIREYIKYERQSIKLSAEFYKRYSAKKLVNTLLLHTMCT